MMADADTLRVVAELVDKMSAPLKQIRQVIKETGAESDKQWRTQKTQQEQLDRGLVQTSRTLREVLSPALQAVGMSTLSMGAAVTAALAATANFGSEMRRLDLMSKQSTMSLNFVKGMERVGEYYNITKEAMDGSLVAFNSFMTGLRRWTPETAQWFTTQKKPVQDFVEQLRRARTDQEAFIIAMRASTQLSAADWRTLSEKMNLGALATMFGVDLPKAYDKANAGMRDFTQQQIADGKLLSDTWTGLTQLVDNYSSRIGAALGSHLEEIKAIGAELNKPFVDQANRVRPAIENFLKNTPATPMDTSKAAPAVPWKPGYEQPGAASGFGGFLRRLWDKASEMPEGLKDLPKMATGGRIEETGAAVVHKGETVLPAGFLGDEHKQQNTLKEGTKQGIVEGLREFFANPGIAGGGGGGGGAAFVGRAGGGFGGSSGFGGQSGAGFTNAPGAHGSAGGINLGGPAAGGMPSTTDMEFITSRGGHNMGDINLKPEMAARLASAGKAYEAATGKRANFGELGRDLATQQKYWNAYQSGKGGLAARPGMSRHGIGEAADIGSGGFNDWLRQGNAGKFGLQTIPGDHPHFQFDRNFGGTGGTAAGGVGSTSVGGRDPASIRYNNPGAQYPSARAKMFGMDSVGTIGGGHLIAHFPTPEQGAAANMDLWNSKYTGRPIGAAGQTWTGSYGFGVPGYDPNAVTTKEMMKDPNFAIPLMKAIAGREAGRRSPLTDDQWKAAHGMFLTGEGRNYKGMSGLLPAAKQSSLMRTKVDGGASLSVDFKGMAQGAKAELESHGIFDKVKIDTGRTGVKASTGETGKGLE